jgi:hypothetical protein
VARPRGAGAACDGPLVIDLQIAVRISERPVVLNWRETLEKSEYMLFDLATIRRVSLVPVLALLLVTMVGRVGAQTTTAMCSPFGTGVSCTATTWGAPPAILVPLPPPPTPEESFQEGQQVGLALRGIIGGIKRRAAEKAAERARATDSIRAAGVPVWVRTYADSLEAVDVDTATYFARGVLRFFRARMLFHAPQAVPGGGGTYQLVIGSVGMDCAQQQIRIYGGILFAMDSATTTVVGLWPGSSVQGVQGAPTASTWVFVCKL